VGSGTVYRMGGRGSIPSGGISRASRPPLWPTQPIINGTGGSSGVRQPGREAEHSPPTSAEVKNGGSIPPLPNVFS
jgi:hypothetical protein